MADIPQPQPQPSAEPSAESSAATELCARCGLTYKSQLAHSCSAVESRPELIATLTPDPEAVGSSASQTATPIPSPAPSPGPAVDALIGTLINDRFEVQKLLGRGGMGAVYQARHRALDTQVAIKVLLQNEGTEENDRFLLEAKIASKVRHPNTVYISDFGQLADGRNYLAMEFLKGRPLSEEVDKGPLPVLRALRIAVQIARGLQAVHDSGIAHRDIKPANVLLVEQDGNPDFVKIVDFGIAKVLAEGPGAVLPLDAAALAARPEGAAPDAAAPGAGSNLTQPGAVMGTPAYMSPEQVRGKRIDARTDQYALGCMLYQMLTGKIPFTGKTSIEVMLQHSDPEARPVPPRQRVPGLELSDALEQLVLRLLAKNPEERFPSMAAVEQALAHELDLILIARGDKRILLAEHVAALDGKLRESARAPAPAPPRRSGAWWAISAGVLLLALLAAGGAYRLLHKPKRPALAPGELAALRTQALAVLRGQLGPAAPKEVRLDALGALAQSRDASVSKEIAPLLQDLGNSGDPQLLATAAEALGQLAEPSSVAPLQAALAQSPPPVARVALAGALHKLRDPGGERQLTEALRAQEPEVQFSAAMLLCAEVVPQAQELLRRYAQLAGAPEPVRQDIFACLAQHGDAEARRRLVDRARGGGPERLDAAGRLLQLGDEAGRAVLQRAVRQGGPEALLAARWLVGPAARWLAGPDEQKSAELLALVAADAGATLAARRLALAGLGDSGEMYYARLCAGLLGPEQPALLRTAAAGAILRLAAQDPGTLGDNSLRWAQGALADRSWLTRQAAVAVLGDTPSADAAALLVKLTRDSDLRLRRSAVQALGRRAEPAALLALRDCLGDAEPEVRLLAIRALGRILTTPPPAGALASTAANAGQRAEAARWLSAHFAHASAREQALVSGILSQLGDKEHRARVQALLTAADPEQRRRFIDSKLVEVAELRRALQDPVPAVRLAAARQLASRGDRYAVPALRELAQRGGVDAVVAYGLLLQLGGKGAEPVDLSQTLIAPEVDQRLAAVSALAYLPPDAALPFLTRAAHDPELLVRSRAAVVASGFKSRGGAALATAVLGLLLTDHDAAVRARTQALLARPDGTAAPEPEDDLREPQAAEAAPSPASPAPAAEPDPSAPVPESATAAAGDAAAGGATLIIEAEPGILYQLDGRGWQVTGPQPLRITPGPHRLSALGSQQDFVAQPEQSVTLRLPLSRAERLARAAEESFTRRDFRKAQRQLDQAISLCGQERQNAVPCAMLSVDMIFRLGQIREQQLEFPEAMNEYQRVTTLFHKVKGRTELKARVAEAMARLRPRVCKVVVRQAVRRRCVEETVWVAPGPRTIKVGGKLEQIQARTDTDLQVGTCQ